jgi:hypothetical protein
MDRLDEALRGGELPSGGELQTFINFGIAKYLKEAWSMLACQLLQAHWRARQVGRLSFHSKMSINACPRLEFNRWPASV